MLHIKAWNADGELVKDVDASTPDESLEFYAHHVLHIDGVVACEISDGSETIRRTDPGVEFDQVVKT